MKKFTKILAVMMVCLLAMALFVACAPNSNPDKAVAKLEKNGYVATKTPGAGNVDCTVIGISKTGYVQILYYKSAKDAKEAYNSIKEKADKDSHKDSDSDWVVGRSGKIIYYGTKDAVKSAR